MWYIWFTFLKLEHLLQGEIKLISKFYKNLFDVTSGSECCWEEDNFCSSSLCRE